jgi:Arc/MetJ-type ribon-helix-helix transcriptional regulator
MRSNAGTVLPLKDKQHINKFPRQRGGGGRIVPLPGTTAGDTLSLMSSAKIAISLDPEALKQVDQLVEGGLFPSRSKLIQDAVAEKLQRMRRVRLAQECAKLQPLAERTMAEERLSAEAEWPEY